ncbi:hypothetical protein [Hydrogenophaga sp. 5NK40-0174]|uniref:hypothetical protein n=1 Tax=Hydrogenophaga sp. 5NK40-0174 TaxID=3127649 RepID=UPI003106978D
MLGPAMLALPALAAEVTPVEAAHRVVRIDGQAPLDDRIVAVPDALEVLWHAPHIRIHYELTVPDGPTGNGLWLQRVGAPFRLTVDGQAVQPFLPELAATRSDDGVFNGRMPFLFALPAGARTVRIELAGTVYIPTGLVAAQWGLPSDLAIAHLRRHEKMSRPTEINTVLASVLGALALILWLVRREVIMLPIFAAICVTLTLRGWSYTVAQLPLNTEQAYLFNSLLSVSLTISVLASLLALTNRLAWRHTRWLLFIAVLLLGPLALAQWIGEAMVLVRLTILIVGLLNIPLCVWLLFRWRAEIAGHAAYVLIAGLCVLLAVSLHDLSWTLGYLPPLRISYVSLAFAVLLLSYAYITADHVLRNLHLVENANVVLNQQVERTRHELEESHQRLIQLQGTEARRGERNRLVSALHMGLGQRLSSLAEDVSRGHIVPDRMQAPLEMCIQSLRQLLSAHQTDGALVPALATWRHAWHARLESVSMTMRWRVDDSADSLHLPAHALIALIDSLNLLMEHLWSRQENQGGTLELHVTEDADQQLLLSLKGTGLNAPTAELVARIQVLWQSACMGQFSFDPLDESQSWQVCWNTAQSSQATP